MSPHAHDPADPFGTARLRAATLAAWLASPDRFREDANTEEDHGRGYYRDRVVTELLQNAADAAQSPSASLAPAGRVLLRLDPQAQVFEVCNTGAPLTADGVRALASMRASTKSAPSAAEGRREGSPVSRPGPVASVGRFGVGFAAVRSVADEIEVVTTDASGGSAGVLFSTVQTAQVLADAAAGTCDADDERRRALATAVAARHGSLPVLRLPFASPPHDGGAAEAALGGGWTTVVRLVLRDDDAVASVRSQLDALDAVTLLALPALHDVRVEDGATGRTIEPPHDWDVVTVTGEHDAADLADRPVEEQSRSSWAVTWALPPGARAGDGGLATGTDGSRATGGLGRVHAPTPTDEPCTLPAVLVASLPLDPTRRHVAPGLATDAVLRAAGEAYARLAERVARRGGDALGLVPTALPAGAVDAALHEHALEALRSALVLPVPAAGDPAARLVAPGDAVMLTDGDAADDPALVAAFARHVDGLVHVPRARRAAARRAGARSRTLTDVVDEVPFADGPLLRALRPHARGRDAEAFAGLRVALLGGAVAPGPRDVLLPPDSPADDGRLTDALHLLGASVADPEHAPADVHDVLERLGVVVASPRVLLDGAAARAAVATLDDALDEAVDPQDLTAKETGLVEALLTIVGAVADVDGDARFAHLDGLPLENEDGELMAARDLSLPGSVAEDLFDGLVPVAAHVVARHGAAALVAVGVRADVVVRTVPDVVATLDADLADDEGPDRWGDYLSVLAHALGDGQEVGDVAVVADLDAVADDRWGRLLERVAGDRDPRAALLVGPGALPSYTAWWLREQHGGPWSRGERAAGASLLPSVPDALADAQVDDAVWRALGAVDGAGDLAALDVTAWARVLEDLPEAGAAVPADEATALWKALADVAQLGEEPPERVVAAVPVADGARSRPTDASLGIRAVVVHAADVVVGDDPAWAQVRAVVPGGPDVADLLDAPFVDELPEPVVHAEGAHPVQPVAGLPGWTRCDRITVDGVDVAWWPGDPVLARDEAGAARGLALAAGDWADRHRIEVVLRAADPETLALEAGW
ncbi:ATP-binding protein [Sanguibacter hominis ATCC BAA-789]|uniref:ATP-binding protein n=1 Tax=Sanguibacter hominis ATCC BAA-789 TaxID=1312740 RepID=A0A9X5FLB7_9MICO|nr:ATP-binding protein [Sanguibacter hominis]NKX94223.1 ATP-binding protein [Sanguibacter hominis ATCC BAA-789]